MEDAPSVADRRRARLEEKLKRELGPAILEALADPGVVEVMLNPDGRLWLDVLGVGMHDTGVRMEPAQTESLLGTVAMMLNTVVNDEHPILEGELPLDGSRIGDAVPVGLFAGWHIEGAEDQVEDREGRGEALSYIPRHVVALPPIVAGKGR